MNADMKKISVDLRSSAAGTTLRCAHLVKNYGRRRVVDDVSLQVERGEVFMIAYWYPQFAVYDDLNGWQTDWYMGNAEFYMDYADYDVALTVPAGWLIGAHRLSAYPLLQSPTFQAEACRTNHPHHRSQSSPRCAARPW